MPLTLKVYENASTPVVISDTNISTESQVINVNLINYAGVKTLIGTALGMGAGVDITATCDFSLVSAGELYEIEVVGDEDEDAPTVLIPNALVGDPVYVWVTPLSSY